jgi:hypothetical protein
MEVVLAVIVVGLPGIDERRCKRGNPVRLPRRFEPGGSRPYSRPVATLLETKEDFSAVLLNGGKTRRGGETLRRSRFAAASLRRSRSAELSKADHLWKPHVATSRQRWQHATRGGSFCCY